MEEWHKPGSHPCFPYLEHWEVENKIKDEEYSQALDRLIKSKPIQFEKEERREPEYEEPPKHTVKQRPNKNDFDDNFYWNCEYCDKEFGTKNECDKHEKICKKEIG